MKKKRGDIINHSAPEDLDHSRHPPWLLDRLEWFQDQKFGLFMHWGIYSVWGICESWPLVPADHWARPDTMIPWIERGKDLKRFSADYRALNRRFNPVKFTPEIWAEAARDAGMKYVCFTTKHHDGFCMFDTRTTDYRITHASCPFHSHPRANVTREIFNTFRERGFGIWCYFSKSDWHVPYYWSPDFPVRDRNPNYDTRQHPRLWEKFVQYTHAQIRELLSDYGRIDVLWLDGGQVRPPLQDIRLDEVAQWGRKLQPGLIMADRTVGGRHENFITPEQRVPEEPPGIPWESCITMGDAWGHRPNENYKPARVLIHLLIDIVAKGGNLLLNVGPSPEGSFDQEALERLREMGEWLRINGEAIFGTRAIAPYKEGNVCFTQKGDQVFALILAEEGRNDPGRQLALGGLSPAAGTMVGMLGMENPLSWEKKGRRVVIRLPEGNLPCHHAWTLRFQPEQRSR